MNLCSLRAPLGSGGEWQGPAVAGLREEDQQLGRLPHPLLSGGGHKGPHLWSLAFPCISIRLAIKCTLTVVATAPVRGCAWAVHFSGRDMGWDPLSHTAGDKSAGSCSDPGQCCSGSAKSRPGIFPGRFVAGGPGPSGLSLPPPAISRPVFPAPLVLDHAPPPSSVANQASWERKG